MDHADMSIGHDEHPQYEVEIRTFVGGFIGLRGKDGSGKPYLVLSRNEWRSFLARIKRGELDYITSGWPNASTM
jgi:hypothetical protein